MGERKRENVPDEQIVSEEEMQKELDKSNSTEVSSEAKEEELSPEDIEKIMDKVQNVNKNGTMVHVIRNVKLDLLHPDNILKHNQERLSTILKYGIIGVPPDWEKKDIKRNNALKIYKIMTNWRRNRYKQEVVYLSEVKNDSLERDSWMHGKDETALIVDTGFASTKIKRGGRNPGGFGTSGNDFAIKTRIPQRFIKGIVIVNPHEKALLTDEESKILSDYDDMINELLELNYKSFLNYIKSNGVKYEGYEDVDKQIKVLKDKIKIELDRIKKKNPMLLQKIENRLITSDFKKNNENLVKGCLMTQREILTSQSLLPIYDQKGNLLFPQAMTNEQVKEFVDERDKAKQEK